MANRRRIASLVGVAASLLFSSIPAWSTPIDLTSGFSVQNSLNELPDGAYQLCTEPDPEDWRDGAGSCLNIVKQGQFASGYYGYPHSSNFICLRGEILEASLTGEALFFSWSAHQWTDFPEEEFTWDTENRLMLASGIPTSSTETTPAIAAEAAIEIDRAEPTEWVTFQQARLNTQDLYLYPSPRMTPPSQLCDWSVLTLP